MQRHATMTMKERTIPTKVRLRSASGDMVICGVRIAENGQSLHGEPDDYNLEVQVFLGSLQPYDGTRLRSVPLINAGHVVELTLKRRQRRQCQTLWPHPRPKLLI